MFALDPLRVAFHTQPRCQLALMFCCIVSPGCGPMKLSYFCAGPFTPVVNATIVLTRPLPCRLQPTPWMASSTQWLSSIPWLTTSICSRCAVHLCMSSTCKRFHLPASHMAACSNMCGQTTPPPQSLSNMSAQQAPPPGWVPALGLHSSCSPQAAGFARLPVRL